MTRTKLKTDPHAAGFTLIEILVVIVIISLVTGIIIGGAQVIQQNAKESQAHTTLTGLIGNAGQYENLTTKPIEHINSTFFVWNGKLRMNIPGREGDKGLIRGEDVAGEDNGNYTYANGDTNDQYMTRANLYIERFIWAANQVPVIREALPSLGKAFGDADDDGFLDIVDPWGNPVAYASSVSHTNDPDDDFLPVHDSPFFASAGKDQMWGRPRTSGEFTSEAAFTAYRRTDEYKFSQDNLYSFDLGRAAAQRGD